MRIKNGDHAATFRDKILSLLLYPLPHHWLSRLIFFLTRLRTPLKNPCIRGFIRQFNVDMSEAVHNDVHHYEHFNAFFTRALKPELRPIDSDKSALVSPVDGNISAIGHIDSGILIQAKHYNYDLLTLLGGQAKLANFFHQGSFTTLYLSPRDYHRIHMPLGGTLRSMIYVPGRLFGVAPHTVRAIPQLFTRNERVISFFESDYGAFAMVLVGAINVAAIETVWHGLVTPPHRRRIATFQYDSRDNITLAKGQEMGRFNMGSTVILLTQQRVSWQEGFCNAKAVKFGQRLAVVQPVL